MELSNLNILFNIITEIKNSEAKSYNTILDFRNDFMKIHHEQINKLPYNFNLLDEVRPNENSHSRILVKLLDFKFNHKNELLVSFLKQIKLNELSEIIKKPLILAEVNRIDATIKEKNKYTIIVENKINRAPDQIKQIERYIQIERNNGFDESNIYILYLTLDGGSPSEDSFSKSNRKRFKNRYKEVNYKYHILPWINELLENENVIAKHNKLLFSAIIQYKNFLEGKFNQREGDQAMTNVMMDLVQEKLCINSTNEYDNYLNIQDTKKYIEELQKYLLEIEKRPLFNVLDEIAKKINITKFNSINEINIEGHFGEKDSCIVFKPKDWNDRFSIQLIFESELADLYFAIVDSKEKSNIKLQNDLKKVLIDSVEPNSNCPYWSWIIEGNNYDEIFDLVENNKLIDILKDKISKVIKNTTIIKELQLNNK